MKSARGASLYSTCLQGSLQKRFWDHVGGIQEVCDIVEASTKQWKDSRCFFQKVILAGEQHVMIVQDE